MGREGPRSREDVPADRERAESVGKLDDSAIVGVPLGRCGQSDGRQHYDLELSKVNIDCTVPFIWLLILYRKT